MNVCSYEMRLYQFFQNFGLSPRQALKMVTICLASDRVRHGPLLTCMS